MAEQIEAAHKVSLAKAEVGIREKTPVPTLRDFIDNDFAPFVESRFASTAKTLEYYLTGLKNLREFDPLANSLPDAITGDKIASFIAKRRQAGLAIASINRQLEVLRRIATSQRRAATSVPRPTRSRPPWSEPGVGIELGIAKAKRPKALSPRP